MFLISLFVLLISPYIPVVKTFNLDISSPDLRIGPPKSLFGFAVVSSSTKQQWYEYSNILVLHYQFCFHRTYVGAPRALLARQRFSTVSTNSTENIPNDRLFGNVFECSNGTNECRPILFESNFNH